MLPADVVSTTEKGVVYVVLADHRLSRRGRLAASVLALAVLALLGLGSTWAGVPPVITAARAPVVAPDQVDALVVGCDGPTTHVAWNSATYSSVEYSVVGDRVASPGDQVGCTLAVTNTGPTAAVMTVSFASVHLAVGTTNPDLAEGLYFVWDVAGVSGSERFDAAVDLGDSVVAQALVPYGGTVPVEVGFVMPASETGHQSGADSTQLSFEVMVRLDESTGSSPPTTGPGTSTPPARPGPSSPSTGTPGTNSGQPGSDQADRGRRTPGLLRLPRTGAELVGTAVVAGAVLVAGTVVWVVARRRRDQQGPAAPGGIR